MSSSSPSPSLPSAKGDEIGRGDRRSVTQVSVVVRGRGHPIPIQFCGVIPFRCRNGTQTAVQGSLLSHPQCHSHSSSGCGGGLCTRCGVGGVNGRRHTTATKGVGRSTCAASGFALRPFCEGVRTCVCMCVHVRMCMCVFMITDTMQSKLTDYFRLNLQFLFKCIIHLLSTSECFSMATISSGTLGLITTVHCSLGKLFFVATSVLHALY